MNILSNNYFAMNPNSCQIDYKDRMGYCPYIPSSKCTMPLSAATLTKCQKRRSSLDCCISNSELNKSLLHTCLVVLPYSNTKLSNSTFFALCLPSSIANGGHEAVAT